MKNISDRLVVDQLYDQFYYVDTPKSALQFTLDILNAYLNGYLDSETLKGFLNLVEVLKKEKKW
jgi:hypothetical protein